MYHGVDPRCGCFEGREGPSVCRVFFSFSFRLRDSLMRMLAGKYCKEHGALRVGILFSGGMQGSG